MNRREFLASTMAAALLGPKLAFSSSEPALSHKVPRWRGFNLLEKFYRNQRFRERDFQWISDWGFDFARLPLDYQQWTDPNDPYQLREEILEHIDEAVELGRKYGVHICLNLHNAPGFTVNASVQHPFSLRHDEEPQRQFAFQWTEFARRYQGISSDRLSFNLVNEPANIDEETYVQAVRGAIDGIRKHAPDRLIITDGLNWGRDPIESLKEPHIAQSTRGYEPMQISHYRANWVQGADQYPVPVWPVPQVNGRLFGSSRSEWQDPLVIEGDIQTAMRLRVRVGQVSSHSRLVIRADGNIIFDRTFTPGPGEGEWERVVHAEEWNVFQNFYERDYTANLPAGVRRIELLNTEGDWMTLREIGLRETNGDTEAVLAARSFPWGKSEPEVIRFSTTDSGSAFHASSAIDADWLRENRIAPWKRLANQGVGVHVGEWGAHQHTPHDVVLRWAEDQLTLWKEAGFGWALWNLRGSFGIIDSGRQDVAYEDLQGHHLDRQFLNLLRAY